MKNIYPVFLVGMSILIIVVSIWSVPRPDVVETTTNEDFSTSLAFNHVQKIASAPHSIGTLEHAAVGQYIISKCVEFGLSPRIDKLTFHKAYGDNVAVATVNNIIVPIKGKVGKQKILIVAHYDSQPNTPGAGDNAAAVAALLELGRFLGAKRSLNNDIVLLFSDAEEIGLLGAYAFASNKENLKDVGMVFNLEGRGNAGPSISFETSIHNGWLIQEYQRAVAIPVANSLSFEVYKRLPNNTDFTVFKNAGLEGLNNAFIEGVANYHSMADTPARLDKRALYHHGSTLFGIAKHFGNLDLKHLDTDNMTYFNVVGSTFIFFSNSWIKFLIIIQGLLISTLVVIIIRSGAASVKSILVGVAGCFMISSILLITLRYAAQILTRIYPDSLNFQTSTGYQSGFLFIGLALLSLLIFIYPAVYLGRKFGMVGVVTGMLILMTILAMAVFRVAISATYIVLLPISGATIFQLVSSLLKYKPNSNEYYSLSFAGAIPGLLILPSTIFSLFVAFGLTTQVAAVAVFLVIGGTITLPLVSSLSFDRREIIAPGLILILSLFMILYSSPLEGGPFPTHIRYQWNIDKNEAAWISWKLDQGNKSYFPSAVKSENGNYASPAQPLTNRRSATLTMERDSLENEKRILRFHLFNPNKSALLSLNFNKPLHVRSIDTARTESGSYDFVKSVDFYGLSPEGVSLEIALQKEEPLECVVSDLSLGLNEVPGNPGISEGSIPMPGYFSNSVRILKKFRFP